jgi:DNA-binding transcriptional LysR family regulator
MFENLFSRQGLSLDRLRGFLEFADAKSIVRAARGDVVRQSLISRQLRELGEFFGVPLVQRQGRGLGLTDAGETLATLIREQFAALQEFSLQAQQLPATLRIMAPNSIAIWYLLPQLRALREALPNYQITIQHEQTATILQSVQDGRCDVGFLRSQPFPSTMGRKAIGAFRYALFIPKTWARRFQQSQPGEWLSWPLALPIGGQLREFVEQLAEKQQRSLQPALTCDSHLQAAAAVESGATMAILPTLAESTLTSRGIVMVEVPELRSLHYKNFLVWNKRAAATRATLSTAIQRILGIFLEN